MGGGGGTVSGYNYYIGLHFGISHGPVDALLEIRCGDLTAWTGEQTASGTVYIDNPTLFGGSGREGGVQGYAAVMMGESTQMPNAYLTAQQGDPQPAYRGVCSLVFQGGLIGSNNPYPKPWAFRVRRTTAGWYGNQPWQPTLAAIATSSGAVGMNPAHIVYETITNPIWGMGYPSAQIDEVNFLAAANQLYSEGFGMCLRWDRTDTIEEFLQKIMDYIAGVLVSAPTTGLFQLNLIRGGYDVSTLPVFTQDDVVDLTSKEDSTISGCTNEIVVKYYDPILKNSQSIIVQALGAIQAQGVVVSTSKDYPGLPTADLAARVAQRELAAVSIPLKRIQIKFNRKLYTLVPGLLFVLNFPDAEITDIIFRVGEVDYGKITDGSISVTAVQDTFSLPSDTYIVSQATGWAVPNPNPSVPTILHGCDAGYRDLLLQLGATETAALPAAAGYIMTMVAQPNGLQYSYALATAPPPYTNFVAKITNHFTPAAVVLENLGPFDRSCTFQTIIGGTLVAAGTAAMIVDGASFEIIRIDAFDAGTGAATIARGCLDSVPAAHVAGIRVFFYDGLSGSDEIQYTTGETVQAKPLTNASNGQLKIGLAPTLSILIAGRAELPYPPAELTVNNVRFDQVTGTQQNLTLGWKERNRVTQADTILDVTAGTVTPETGTTYTVKLFDSTMTLFQTITGISAPPWTWTPRDTTHLDVYAQVNTVTANGTSLQGPITELVTLAAYVAPDPRPPVPYFASGNVATPAAGEGVPIFNVFMSVNGLFAIGSQTLLGAPLTGYRDDYYDSLDGVTWTHRADPGNMTQFPGVAGGNAGTSVLTTAYTDGAQFYGVQNATGYFWKSGSGTWYTADWTQTVLPYQSAFTYANGQFIAWGNGYIATSPDFKTWTQQPLGLAYNAALGQQAVIIGLWWDATRSRYAVATNYYVKNAVSQGGGFTTSVRFWTTPDLVNFTELVADGTPESLIVGCASNGATLVCVGKTATTASELAPSIWTSTDAGNTWTQRSPTVTEVSITQYGDTQDSRAQPLQSVVYDGTQFLCSGFGILGKSGDGVNWSWSATGTLATATLYANGTALLRVDVAQTVTPIADGNEIGYAAPAIYSSTDHGVTWSQQFGQAPGSLFVANATDNATAIAYNNGEFLFSRTGQRNSVSCVALIGWTGNGTPYLIGTTTDTLRPSSVPYSYATAGTLANPPLVAAGADYRYELLYQPELVAGSPGANGPVDPATQYYYGTPAQRFLISGSTGGALTIVSDSQPIVANQHIVSILRNGGTTFAICTDSTVWTSPDGITWTKAGTAAFVAGTPAADNFNYYLVSAQLYAYGGKTYLTPELVNAANDLLSWAIVAPGPAAALAAYEEYTLTTPLAIGGVLIMRSAGLKLADQAAYSAAVPNGQDAAYAAYWYNLILRSTDGANWTIVREVKISAETGFTGTPTFNLETTLGNAFFLYGADAATNQKGCYLTSSDGGNTWTGGQIANGDSINESRIYSILSSGTRLAGLDNLSSNAPNFRPVTSTDGINFTPFAWG